MRKKMMSDEKLVNINTFKDCVESLLLDIPILDVSGTGTSDKLWAIYNDIDSLSDIIYGLIGEANVREKSLSRQTGQQDIGRKAVGEGIPEECPEQTLIESMRKRINKIEDNMYKSTKYTVVIDKPVPL